MIESLLIKSFQSHKYSFLEFAPGVNIIIGKSDSGKTAIIRSLGWLINNRPGGDAFRSSFGGDTEVTIVTQEGDSITRAKNKENLYQLNDARFTAFGTEIPKEISEVLNISSINISKQFDMPYLLNDSSGEVATHFNKIAHIDAIDTSVKKVQGWIREIDQNIKSDQRQLQKVDEELLAYQNLEMMEMDLEVLESLEKDLIATTNSKNKLFDLYSSVLDIEKEINELLWWYELENDLTPILELFETSETETDFKGKLEETIFSIQDIEREISIAQSFIDLETDANLVLDQIEQKETLEKTLSDLIGLLTSIADIEEHIQEKAILISMESEVVSILNLFQSKEETKKEQDTLVSSIDEIKKITIKIKDWKVYIDEQTELFDAEMGEVCPLCNQPITTH